MLTSVSGISVMASPAARFTHDPDPEAYATALTCAAADQPKGFRTRAQIAAAAASVALDSTGPGALKVADICAAAGILNGTFYLYLSDRDALLADVLHGVIGFLTALVAAVRGPDPVRAPPFTG
jgi:AcrR family transcriptional regulator